LTSNQEVTTLIFKQNHINFRQLIFCHFILWYISPCVSNHNINIEYEKHMRTKHVWQKITKWSYL